MDNLTIFTFFGLVVLAAAAYAAKARRTMSATSNELGTPPFDDIEANYKETQMQATSNTLLTTAGKVCLDEQQRTSSTKTSDKAPHVGNKVADNQTAIDPDDDEQWRRPVSYIRFSGYPRSDVTDSDRSSSGASYWSSLSLFQRGSSTESTTSAESPKKEEESAPSAVDRIDVEVPRSNLMSSLLFFKPQQHRILTTKHLKRAPRGRAPPDQFSRSFLV